MNNRLIPLLAICGVVLSFDVWFSSAGKNDGNVENISKMVEKSLTIWASDTRAYGPHGRNQSVCSAMLGARGKGLETVYYLAHTCNDLNIGNKLSRLYMSNAMAMAIGAEFIYVCPTHRDTQNKGSIMTRLAQVRMDSRSDDRHFPQKLKSLEDLCAACDSNHPHQCVSGEIGLAVPTLIEDLQRTSKHALDYHENSFDVALHYRCGDILGLHTEKYGLLPHSTFVRLIKERHDREDNVSIAILSGIQSARPQDLIFADACQTIVEDLIFYLKLHFPNAAISVPSNGSIAIDYFRLMRAKSIAICASSTFCLWPTLANTRARRVYNSQRLFPFVQSLDLPGIDNIFFESIMLKPRRNETIMQMGVPAVLAWLQTH